MNFIHPTVDKEEFIAKFVTNYGEVLDHFPNVTARYGIPDGSYTFIMKENDLAKNKLQESVFINKVQSFIAYRTQEQTCFNCGNTGHNSNDCPDKEYVAFPMLGAGNGEQGKKINLVLPGFLLPTKQQVTNNRKKLNRFQMSKVQVPPVDVVENVLAQEAKQSTTPAADASTEKVGNGSGDGESEAGDDDTEAGDDESIAEEKSEAGDDESVAGEESEAVDEKIEEDDNPDDEMEDDNLDLALVEEIPDSPVAQGRVLLNQRKKKALRVE